MVLKSRNINLEMCGVIKVWFVAENSFYVNVLIFTMCNHF